MNNKKTNDIDGYEVGSTVLIFTKDEAKRNNPDENIDTPFWDTFAGKRVEVEKKEVGYLVCGDGDTSCQVYTCDIKSKENHTPP